MVYKKTLPKAGRTDRRCPRCEEYEVDEDGYCHRCRRKTRPPL